MSDIWDVKNTDPEFVYLAGVTEIDAKKFVDMYRHYGVSTCYGQDTETNETYPTTP